MVDVGAVSDAEEVEEAVSGDRGQHLPQSREHVKG